MTRTDLNGRRSDGVISDAWEYHEKGPKEGGDQRCICTIETDGMVYVGIAIWTANSHGWFQNGAPLMGRVLAWRPLPEPAKGRWVRGKLVNAVDAAHLAAQAEWPSNGDVKTAAKAHYVSLVGDDTDYESGDPDVDRMQEELHEAMRAALQSIRPPAGVVSDEWEGEIECCDAKGVWMILSDNCPFVPGEKVKITAPRHAPTKD